MHISGAAARAVTCLAAASALLVGLTACGADSEQAGVLSASSARVTPSPVPSPVPPVPTSTVDVPVRSAAIDAQPAQPVDPPVRIRIDDLGIDMSVVPVGLAETGSMELPPNPADAAWYRFGPSPAASAGGTVIAAHVDSLVYDLGPFAKLPDAPVGTEIIVDTGSGEALTYRIESNEMTLKQDVPWSDVFSRTGNPRLTVVTCGGEFDYDRLTYLSNVVVTAVPVD